MWSISCGQIHSKSNPAFPASGRLCLQAVCQCSALFLVVHLVSRPAVERCRWHKLAALIPGPCVAVRAISHSSCSSARVCVSLSLCASGPVGVGACSLCREGKKSPCIFNLKKLKRLPNTSEAKSEVKSSEVKPQVK